MTKRRFFQIHLSTAVVLMCVCGALIGSNLKPYYSAVPDASFGGTTFNKEFEFEVRGFPFVYDISVVELRDLGVTSFRRGHLAANILCALAFIALIAIGSEHLIRRREARQR